MTTATTFLFIHPLPHQGRRQLDDRWPELVRLLRLHFRGAGIEDQESSSSLLIFSFHHPCSALACLDEGLARLKKELGLQESREPLPLRMVLHLAQPGDRVSEMAPLSPELWGFLRPETLYITRPLKLQWERLTSGSRLAPHSFEPVDQGLFQVRFKGQNMLKGERLFTSRELPLLGGQPQCFYCGMTHHEPASCPSKLLDWSQQGLSLIGYLPVAELNDLYRTVITDHQELVAQLAAGVKSSRIRQDVALQVFLAFFDLNRLFQLRFLHQIAFSFSTGWAPHVREENLRITNRNLHLGLDCLRVGQYKQAEQIFNEELSRPKGNQFCALVGQGFCALEQGRPREMESFLQKALALAGLEKEQIYINLLLSRYHDLQGDRWQAEHAVDTILSQNRTQPEGLYRKCQLLAGNGLGEQGSQQLRDLIADRREMFISVLIDPLLVPIQWLMEDLLAAHAREANRQARENLERATAEYTELRGWFEEEEQDEELETLAGNLAEIESRYERGSYYDLLDVAGSGERIHSRCHRLREAKIDRFKERFREVSSRWDGYHDYWSRYLYQFLFSGFGETLQSARKKLEEARELTRQVRGETYLAASAKVMEAAGELDELQPLFARMAWVNLALQGLRVFGRKLVITEFLFISMALLLFFVFQNYLGGTLNNIPAQLLAQPWFLKQAASIVTLFLAPIAALALTLWEINDR